MSTTPSNSPPSYWRKCTTCKSLIGFHEKYWVCSVSTCNRKRTGLIFCDVACFDAHVPVLNHKDAGAIEKRSPTLKSYLAEKQEEEARASLPAPSPSPVTTAPRPPTAIPSAPEKKTPAQTVFLKRNSALESTRVVVPGSGPPPPSVANTEEEEILVVVSKLKAYIRARSGFNTSDSVMELLSDRIRILLRDAIRSAERNGRKTVLDRDF